MPFGNHLVIKVSGKDHRVLKQVKIWQGDISLHLKYLPTKYLKGKIVTLQWKNVADTTNQIIKVPPVTEQILSASRKGHHFFCIPAKNA